MFCFALCYHSFCSPFWLSAFRRQVKRLYSDMDNESDFATLDKLGRLLRAKISSLELTKHFLIRLGESGPRL